MKTLVVYFSRAGHASLTARVAKDIAKRCDAHIDTIKPKSPYTSWFHGWRYGWQALSQAEPPIQRPSRNPANYDLVVVGVPITRAGLAPPVRSYVRRYGSGIKHLALFCAEGTGREERGFLELSMLYGKPPLATFGVVRKNLSTIADRAQLNDFVDSLGGSLAGHSDSSLV